MPAPQIRDAVDMDVNPYAFGPTPRGAQAQVGHFGPHARQRHESVDGVGYVARVVVAEDGRGRLDVSGLVVVEADDVDELVERDGVHRKDVFEREARGRELRLQAAHGDGVGGVLGLGG